MLAGVISANSSKIGIHGDSIFTNNSGGFSGGEKGRETCVVENILLQTTTVVLVAGKHCFGHVIYL